MEKRYINFAIVILVLQLTSCLKKKTKSPGFTTTSPTTNFPTNPSPFPTPYPTPNPNPTPDFNDPPCLYGNGEEPGISDAGQTIDYYRINILAHGHGDGVVAWSSSTDMDSNISQNIFVSDSRLNIRVIPKYHNKGNDSKGVLCKYTPRPYKKLKVGVRVTGTAGLAGDYYEFNHADINCASTVHSFNIPPGSTPPIIEILNVKWDWSCQSYLNQGFSESDVPGFCPWDNVWLTECYGLEIQVATDSTKDLPGPKL